MATVVCLLVFLLAPFFALAALLAVIGLVAVAVHAVSRGVDAFISWRCSHDWRPDQWGKCYVPSWELEGKAEWIGLKVPTRYRCRRCGHLSKSAFSPDLKVGDEVVP